MRNRDESNKAVARQARGKGRVREDGEVEKKSKFGREDQGRVLSLCRNGVRRQQGRGGELSEPRSRDGGRYECECECERVRATDTGLATATAVNTWKARTTLGFMGKLRQRPGVGLGLGWAGLEGYTRGTVTSETLEKRVL